MSVKDTIKHILNVQEKINDFIIRLEARGKFHDESKLLDPEVAIFEKFTPLLAKSTYGSDEYKQFLIEMKPALDHHYANNRHHPEHFKYWECNGCFKRFRPEPMVCNVCGYSQFTERPDISEMTLIDLVEMFCDWKAAVERHNNGDILKSIEINSKRFEISDQLKQILINTANEVKNE